jgi:hypothetical protein
MWIDSPVLGRTVRSSEPETRAPSTAMARMYPAPTLPVSMSVVSRRTSQSVGLSPSSVYYHVWLRPCSVEFANGKPCISSTVMN